MLFLCQNVSKAINLCLIFQTESHLLCNSLIYVVLISGIKRFCWSKLFRSVESIVRWVESIVRWVESIVKSVYLTIQTIESLSKSSSFDRFFVIIVSLIALTLIEVFGDYNQSPLLTQLLIKRRTAQNRLYGDIKGNKLWSWLLLDYNFPQNDEHIVLD